jgi:antitoxin MazE
MVNQVNKRNLCSHLQLLFTVILVNQGRKKFLRADFGRAWKIFEGEFFSGGLFPRAERYYNVITVMEVELVRIGNSRGIRIPKGLIEQCGLGKVVELRVAGDRLVISARRAARAGWGEAFERAGASAEDELLLEGVKNEFDGEEWEW